MSYDMNTVFYVKPSFNRNTLIIITALFFCFLIILHSCVCFKFIVSPGQLLNWTVWRKRLETGKPIQVGFR